MAKGVIYQKIQVANHPHRGDLFILAAEALNEVYMYSDFYLLNSKMNILSLSDASLPV